MRKVIVTCPCGQRMQVSRSAYGKTGICPKCNQKIRVGANGVEPLALPSPDSAPSPTGYTPPFQFQERQNSDSETAKRNFAWAVDLFYHARYGEALAILDDLRKDLPGNAQIETAHARCLHAIKAPAEKPENTQPAAEPAHGTTSPPPPHGPKPAPELNPQAVNQTVLHLMTSGSTDSVRLQAAELASRILGLLTPPDADDKPRPFFAKLAPSNGKTNVHAPIPTESPASIER